MRPLPSIRVCSIDPGNSHTGVAILEPPDRLCWVQHLTPTQGSRNGQQHHADPIVRWWKRLEGIVLTQRPTHIVYEDYVWQGQKRMSNNSPALFQLIGVIRCLTLVRPYPSVTTLHPGKWRQQLTGDATADERLVDWVLKQRLGRSLLDDGPLRERGHIVDAVGVGLAYLDIMQWEQHIAIAAGCK